MLTKQIIEFKLRGLGPLGRTCSPTQGRIYEGGALGHGPPFGSPGLQNCIEKWAKLSHGPPPFASWASDFGLEITRFGHEIWVKTFFFVLHLISGEKWDEIWVWQFQILIYVHLKISEVFGPPFSKSCVRYCTYNWLFSCQNKNKENLRVDY